MRADVVTACLLLGASGLNAAQAADGRANVRDVGPSTFAIKVTGTVVAPLDPVTHEPLGDPEDPQTPVNGATCINRGTGFVLTPDGLVATARHLFTSEACELQGVTQADNHTLHGWPLELGHIVISAYRGPHLSEERPITGSEPRLHENPDVDVATFRLAATNRGYSGQRPCVDFLTTGNDVDMFGFLGGADLVPRPGQYARALGDVGFELNGEGGGGMSGGPVYASSHGPVGMISKGDNGNLTVAVSMLKLSQFTQLGFDNCDRHPEPIERIGLRLDRATIVVNSVGAGQSSAAGETASTYQVNRQRFATRFLNNETELIQILGQRRAGAIQRNDFYDNPENLFELLGGVNDRTRWEDAVLDFSQNAFALTKFDSGMQSLTQALTLHPDSLALRDRQLDRLTYLERFSEAVQAVEEMSPDPRTARPTDTTQRQYLMSILSYYAWSLNEMRRDAESERIFSMLLELSSAWPDVGAQGRYSVLSDRTQLFVDRLNRTDEALGGLREAQMGVRRLLAAAPADQQGELEGLQGRIENNLAWVLSETGDLEQALVFAQSALRRKQSAQVVRPLAVVTSLTNVGNFQVRLGDVAGGEVQLGLDNLLQAEAFYEDYHDAGQFYQVRLARLQKDIGFAYLLLGDRERAEQRFLAGFRQLAAAHQTADDQYLRNLFLLGYFHITGENYQEALSWLMRADTQNHANHSVDPDIEALIDLFRGEALLRTGSREPGEASVRRALEDLNARPDVPYILYFMHDDLVARANGLLAQQ